MLFSQDRAQLRNFYLNAWHKYQQEQPLEPLEKEIVAVITEHPEYQKLLQDIDSALNKDFSLELGESNPFLHLSLHIGIREQITTNRPTGICTIYQELNKVMSSHDAEHQMLEVLAECIWEMQRSGIAIDEQTYLQKLQQLLDPTNHAA